MSQGQIDLSDSKDQNDPNFDDSSKYEQQRAQVKKRDSMDDILDQVRNEEKTQKGQKSIYETFIDVSGMFSNPIASFGNQRQAIKSRFIADAEEPSSEDEYDRNMATTANHAVNSIFSSDTLFG